MFTRSLYLHFPFCESKCHYCDFYSLGRDGLTAESLDKYAGALKKEAQQTAPFFAPQLNTVFFGGGTPSLFSADAAERALEPILKDSSFSPAAEFTIEANPSSLNRKTLSAWRRLGVNRLSLGIQSLNSETLKLLGRVHTRERALEAVEGALSEGFTNISVDLLCGVPGQSLKDLEEALDTLFRFPLTHLSCYLLTLTADNPLFKQLPNEDIQLEHLLCVDRWLAARGFEHYEISNFCLPGFRSLHNMNYWKGESYVGLGPSAHSFDAPQGERWKNFSTLDRWLAALHQNQPPIEWRERLSLEQREIEKWMLGLRLLDGFPVDWLDTQKRQVFSKRLIESGLLEPHPKHQGFLRPTPRGFALNDELAAGLI